MTPKPYVNDPDFVLYCGDVREVLSELEPGTVDCCVTSPPYWGLRDYGTGTWTSALRRDYHHVGSCPACHGRLVRRPDTQRFRPGTVLDVFMGSGTTAKVARRLGRRSIGVELNPEYAALCAKRLQQLSLLAETAA